jgi:bis(5'-nucleosyl)-tetraphosphatase (symmetrical)
MTISKTSIDSVSDNSDMGLYLIGDVQGCDDALERLLAEVGFSASRDRIIVLGDLVNRGPGSLAVLRRLKALNEQGAAQCLLGNHDLHTLAVAAGVRPAHRSDTLSELLAAPDRASLLGWLREQSLALLEGDLLMVHAGVLPSWDAQQTVALGQELSAALRSREHAQFLQQMYGNEPAQWHDSLVGIARLRVIVNALTRLRFCSAEGVMEFATKEGADGAPEGYMPWFEVPKRRTQNVTVAFGHWSTLGLIDRPALIALDTGCVWGGCLSAMRVDGERRELIQVKCPQSQKPG